MTISREDHHEISINWTIDDIREKADNDSIFLTDDQCIDVLLLLEKNYNPDVGINWVVIDKLINHVVKLNNKQEVK